MKKPFKLFGYEVSKIRPPKPKEDKPGPRQTRDAFGTPFDLIQAYQPNKHNFEQYRLIRETLPICNVAIQKLVRLDGDPIIESLSGDRIQTKIDQFMKKVRVDQFGHGFGAYLDQLEDSAFETGGGWGELVPNSTMTDVYCLKVANAADIRWIKNKETGVWEYGTIDANGFQVIKIQNPELIHNLTFDRRQGHPQGYSLMYSTVVAAQVFSRWMLSFESQVERYADPAQAIIMGAGPKSNPAEVQNLLKTVLDEWAEIQQLKKVGQTGDLGIPHPEGGEAKIQTIGHDAKFAGDFQLVRTIEELIVMQMGLSPSDLGLSWSSRESQADVQRETRNGEINRRRQKLEGITEQTLDMFLILTGDAGAKYTIRWPEIDNHDQTEQAKARQLTWMANEKMVNTLVTMMDYNFIKQEGAEAVMIDAGLKFAKEWYTKAKNEIARKRLIEEFLG